MSQFEFKLEKCKKKKLKQPLASKMCVKHFFFSHIKFLLIDFSNFYNLKKNSESIVTVTENSFFFPSQNIVGLMLN